MVRFGFSGCGGFAERAVLPLLQRVENAKAVAACDKRNIDDVCNKFGLAAFGSLEEMLESAEIEAVYVCSPNVFHKGQIITAAKAGKHVMCEKPLGLNAQECREAVEVCKASYVKLGVDFCYPLAGAQQKAKQLAQEGAIGEVSHIHISFNLGTYNKETVGWRCDPKMSGGGPLMDVAPHLVHLASFFLEDTAESVMAYVRPPLTDTDIEQDVVAIIEFSRGGRATIDTSFVRGNTHSYSVAGQRGEIRAFNTMCWGAGGELTLICGTEEQNVSFEPVEGIEEHFRLFSQAIERDESPPIPGEAGLHVQAVIDAIYESGRSAARCDVAK